MRHRLQRIFTFLCLLISAIPLFSQAVNIDGINYTLYSDGYAIVGSNKSYVGDCVIPASVYHDGRNYPVISIEEKAFKDNTGLTTVSIPASITAINKYAFMGCSNLTSVNITDLTAWCKILFKDYTSNPLYYAHALYLNGEKVLNLVISESTTAIKDYAFYGFSDMTSVTIPNSVTEIGVGAFGRCAGLTSVTIPNSVTKIDAGAFENCTALTSVSFQESVSEIGNAAFSGCINLAAVYITDLSSWCKILFNDNLSNPLSIAHRLYLNGEEVTDLVIPESVTDIVQYSFYNCSSLTSVTISNSVIKIGTYAFNGCVNLASTKIGNSVSTIDRSAFYGCSSLSSLEIGNSVTSIGGYAFNRCKSLTSIAIPSSVESIGKEAFSSCSGLTSVHIKDLTAWCKISFGGLGANPLSEAHRLYLNGTEITELIIPTDITTIGNYAFYGYSGMTSLDMHDHITSIGNYAFWNCTSLNSLVVPNSVTTIGTSAFSGCKGLEFVKIGNSVSLISKDAFLGCSGMTQLEIPPSVTRIGTDAFIGCTGLTTLHIQDLDAWCRITFIDYYSNPMTFTHNLYLNGTEITHLVIPESVNTISGYAFYGGSKFSSIEIPTSVTKIGSYAFCNCRGLTSISIPNTVSQIQSFAFANCSELKSMTLGSAVSKIGGAAFNGCKSLVDITSLNTNPPSIDHNPDYTAFATEAYQNATLHVPVESLEDYKTAPYWKNFKNINSDISGVEDVTVNEVDAPAEYYRLDGVKAGYGTEGLAPGIYIKRKGCKTEKVTIH